MLKAKPQPEKSLAERIEELQAEIDKYIDGLAQAEYERIGGIPFGVIRNLLVARAGDCRCSQYRHLLEQN